MEEIKILKLFKILLILAGSFQIAACGKLSNKVDVTFDRTLVRGENPDPNSPPFIGLISAAGTRTSGNYKLEASVGNQTSVPVMESGTYKLFGGIQGQVLSR